MERHFEQDLARLKERLLTMGSLAEKAVEDSVTAVLEADEKRARAVFEAEEEINRLQIEIDDRVLRLLALQQPMAVDLRFILAVAKINSDLERLGDQAVNIAKAARRIMQHPRVHAHVDLPQMSRLAQEMLRDSLNALVSRDTDLAKTVLLKDDKVDHLRDQIFRELLSFMMQDSAVVFVAFDLILVAKNLERVADHATNIAEDVIYLVQGRDVRHPTTPPQDVESTT